MTDHTFTRRSFLATGAAMAGAAAIAPSVATAQPKILNQQEGMTYRPVPGTDVLLSSISLGGLVMGEAVRRYAIDKGVNFFHISNTYLNGESIKELGKVMKDHRDKVYIAAKDTFRYGNGQDDIGSILSQLNTDHIDFIMFNRHDPSEVMDDTIQEYFEKWKKEGKVRWAGLTIHKKVKETTEAGIQTKFYRLVMPTLNQSSLDSMQEEMRLAEENGVGIMAMKTMGGLKGIEQETAYIKKLLAIPAVSTINKGIGSFDMFDAYAEAAQKTLTSSESKMLYRYAQANRSSNCMMCSECEGACPNGIEISTLLRCSDYYVGQYGWTEHAQMTYAEVPAEKRAAMCQDCGACEEVCPNRIPIREHLKACREIFC